MVDTQPSTISLDNIQGLVDRIPRGIPLPMNKSDQNPSQPLDLIINILTSNALINK